MILIRRCRGFRNGVPIPHRRWFNRRTGTWYATDSGPAFVTAHNWRWCCLDSTNHRFGITGSGPTREVATVRAEAHYRSYHCGPVPNITVHIHL